MHSVVWKFIRYVLWVVLVLILGLLFIGLSKFDWNVKWYVQFLNERSRSDSREQGGINNIFWDTAVTSDEWQITSTWDLELGTWNLELSTGLDVYDPSFEEDLNQIPQNDVILDDDTTKDFGFVTSGALLEDDSTDPKDQLLELIKEREMQ